MNDSILLCGVKEGRFKGIKKLKLNDKKKSKKQIHLQLHKAD